MHIKNVVIQRYYLLIYLFIYYYYFYEETDYEWAIWEVSKAIHLWIYY